MKRNVVFMISGVLLIGALGAAILGQAQNTNKSKTASGTAAIPSTANRSKATSLGLPPEAMTAENALYAESDRLQREAASLLRSGDLTGAEQAAQGALATSPIIQGEKHPRPVIPLLLGDIRLQQGRYQEALGYYLPAGKNTWHSGLNLDVALCYIRLGNWQMAQRFYSDAALSKYSTVKQNDLPGTATPQSLEASIVLAHGLEAFFRDRNREALADLEAASKLAPKNGLIAYYAGMSLLDLDRRTEAKPYFRRAVQYGRGKILAMAQERVAAYPPPK